MEEFEPLPEDIFLDTNPNSRTVSCFVSPVSDGGISTSLDWALITFPSSIFSQPVHIFLPKSDISVKETARL